MEKNFIIYKSSAGSGKTYTLVKEYLKIVLSQSDSSRYRNILAITFTNKAANELKERVLENLLAISADENSEHYNKILLDDYVNSFGLDHKTIKKRAKAVFESILHNYTDLKVSTIDKFTYKIIRAFSRDLGLQNDFDIEMDTDLLLKKTINEIISDIDQNPNLQKILTRFVDKQIENDKSWNIENQLYEFAKELIKEDNKTYLEQIGNISLDQFIEVSKEIFLVRNELKNNIQKNALDIISLINSAGISFDFFPRKTLPNYYLEIGKGNFEKSLSTPKTIHQAIEEDKWLNKTSTEDIISALSPIKSRIIAIHDQIELELSHYFLIDLIYSNINSLSLVSFIYKKLEEIKDQEGILMISDFNQIIANEIKNQPAPFIYEKIGERYKNIMIDEFQDTSVLQWQNLLPLIDNSLAFGYKNLIVGDAKQAIYRFRGGKVEQFAQLPKVFQHQNDSLLLERQNSLIYNHAIEELETNYRSHCQIIDFNNWLFSEISENLDSDYKKNYDNVSQKSITSKNEGYVDIKFIDSKEVENIEQEYLDNCLINIKENLKDGFDLKDIAILVRGKKESVLVSDFLLEHSLPVITSESLVIHKNKEVHFLINFFKYIVSNNNNSAKIELIKYLIEQRKLNQKILHQEQLDLEKILLYLDKRIEEIVSLDVSIYDLTEHIIRSFELSQNKTNPFILSFLEQIQNFSKYQNDISSFLDWWNEKGNKISISTPDNLNAIKIMSIHKSKGLQFPVIIFPFVNWEFKPRGKQIQKWINNENLSFKLPVFLIPLKKQLAKTSFAYLLEEELKIDLLDNINLLYVALTRPEKRLYVVSDNKVYNSKKEIKSNQISSYLWQVINRHSDFDANELNLILGSRKRNNSPNSDGLNNYTTKLKSISTANWRDKVKLSQTYKKHWHKKEYQEWIEFGNNIHLILSKITDSSKIEETINQLITDGLLNKFEKEKYLLETYEIFKIPEVKKWFSSNGIIKNECELITDTGEILRPDKVIIENTRTLLIDFKTGEPNTQDKKQINNYKNILEKIGYQNIEKYILYTSLRKVERI